MYTPEAPLSGPAFSFHLCIFLSSLFCPQDIFLSRVVISISFISEGRRKKNRIKNQRLSNEQWELNKVLEHEVNCWGKESRRKRTAGDPSKRQIFFCFFFLKKEDAIEGVQVIRVCFIYFHPCWECCFSCTL